MGEPAGCATRDESYSIDLAKQYSLAELIDLAEEHNPETRAEWHRAKAAAASVCDERTNLLAPARNGMLRQLT